MRRILVDWMIQASSTKFKMNLETQFLAIRLFDRYLTQHNVSRNTLQLVGTMYPSSLLLSLKRVWYQQ